MTHEDKIIEEFNQTFNEKGWWKISEAFGIGEHVPAEPVDVEVWLKKALTTYRAQVLGKKKMELEEEFERGGWSANQMETLRDLFDEDPTN